MFQIESILIEEIQKNRKAFIDKFYLGDLEKKYLDIVESLYIKNDDKFQTQGKVTEEFYLKLKKSVFDVSVDK